MIEQKDLRHEANLQGMRLLMASKDERIAKLETLVGERDAMLGKRPCQNSRCNELNAARELLREVSDFGLYVTPGSRMDYEGEKLTGRIYAYLDACDKSGEPT